MGMALFSLLSYEKNISVWLLVPVAIALGGAAYFTILWLMRVPELSYILNGVKRRFNR
jgi:hypothetical protein